VPDETFPTSVPKDVEKVGPFYWGFSGLEPIAGGPIVPRGSPTTHGPTRPCGSEAKGTDARSGP